MGQTPDKLMSAVDEFVLCLARKMYSLADLGMHSKENGTDLGKCTHLDDETQGNNEIMKHRHFQQKIVFARCKKVGR